MPICSRTVRPQRPPSHEEARDYIVNTLSTKTPEASHFPNEVLASSKLDYENFEHTIDQLSKQLLDVLPRTRQTAALHDTLAGMPEQLNKEIRDWYRRHPKSSMRALPVGEFNLRVVDLLRRAMKDAERLADNKRATPEEREFGRVLGPMLQAMKRHHYTCNVHTLYRESGARMHPHIAASDKLPRPGYVNGVSATLTVEGGAGTNTNGVKVQGTGLFGYTRLKRTEVMNDGDIFCTDGHRVTIGGRLGQAFGVPTRLASTFARIDTNGTFATQTKSSTVEQFLLDTGGMHKHDSSVIGSAAPGWRSASRVIAHIGNTASGFLIGSKAFDSHQPFHATVSKTERGIGAAPLIIEQARQLDELSGLRPKDSPGPFETLMSESYPSLAQRTRAMGAPETWTGTDIDSHFDSPKVTPPRGPRNAPGIPGPARCPQRSHDTNLELEFKVKPTQDFAADDSDHAADEPSEDDASVLDGSEENALRGSPDAAHVSRNPKFGIPSASAKSSVPIIDGSEQAVQRLVKSTEYFNPGRTGDLGGALRLAEQMNRSYAAAWPPGGIHPHLASVERASAFRRLTLMLPEQDKHELARGLPPIFGNPAEMPDRHLRVIAGVLQGRLDPFEVLQGVDNAIVLHAREDTRLASDCERAWALRRLPEGQRLLHELNERCFEGRVPLSAHPGEEEFEDMLTRLADVRPLALANLELERSVALCAGARSLRRATAKDQSRFQSMADQGAKVLAARLNFVERHVGPLDDEHEIRSSSIVGTAVLESRKSTRQLQFVVNPGFVGDILQPMESEFGNGALALKVGVTKRRQTGAIHPALRGFHKTWDINVDASAPTGNIASAILGAGRQSGDDEAAEDQKSLTQALMAIPMKAFFERTGSTFQLAWRMAPDEPGQEKSRPVAAPVQYARIVTERKIGPNLTSPNVVKAFEPGVLKFGFKTSAETARTVHQQNGPCPALNMLEYPRLRKLMVKPTGEPLAFEEMEQNFQLAPQEAIRLFSPLNPIPGVNALFSDAVRDPHGPHSEFHRMLYGSENATLRKFGRESMTFAPDKPGNLFQETDSGEWFARLTDTVPDWSLTSPEQEDALTRMSPRQRMAWFFHTREGREQVLRYIDIMELSTSFYNIAKNHGDGYVARVDEQLIDRRKMIMPVGHERSRRSGLRVKVKDAISNTRIPVAHTSRPRPASTARDFSFFPSRHLPPHKPRNEYF